MKRKEKRAEKARTLRSVLGAALEMPADVMSGAPLLTLLGRELLTVENHRGIMKYARDEIILDSVSGKIEITGRDLELRSILPEEIKIGGCIEGMFIGRQ